MKAGRKSKYTPAAVKAILEAVSLGTPITHAAKAAGISFETLTVWREKHREFSDALDQAFSKSVRANLKIVRKATRSKDQRLAFQAAAWWLTHAAGAREYFSDSQKTTTHVSINSDRVVLYLPQKSDPPQLHNNVPQIEFNQE